jgi:hypothetical protein
MAAAIVNIRVPARAQWNTLRRLRSARLVLLLLLGFLLALLIAAIRLQHDAIKTVGQDAVPSILAAQRIKAAMAGMDAELANGLLLSGDNSAPSLTNYDAQRIEAAAALVAAAENITYGESERGPVRTLQNGLSVYEDLVERARDLHELQGGDAGSAAVLAAYGQAQTLMDRSLLPAADDLDQANLEQLEARYRGESSESGAARVLIGLLGLGLLGALLAVQISLSRRTQRTFNLALVGATVLTALLAAYALHALAGAQADLQSAKQDAFTAIHALWRARATAYQAKSEESRYLFDTGHAGVHETAFAREASEVADLPDGLTGTALVTALRDRRDVDGFHGYLAEDLSHTAIPGEREAVLTALEVWQRYIGVDARIRKLERAGQHKDALELSTGTMQGQSDWEFNQFNAALGKALAIDQASFDDAIREGRDGVRWLDAKALVGVVAIAGLILAGFAPRIREYM